LALSAVSSGTVIPYGIASGRCGDIQDWYLRRDDAERTLASILRDEPTFAGDLWVEDIDFEYCFGNENVGGAAG
jgi:hypothetical protein